MVSPDKIGGSGGGEGDFSSSWSISDSEEIVGKDFGQREFSDSLDEDIEDDSDMKIWGEESGDDIEEVIEENGEKVKIYKKGNKVNAKMPKSDFVRGWHEAWEKKQQGKQSGLKEKPSEVTKVVLGEDERRKGPIFEVGAFGASAAEVVGKYGPESEDAFYVNREDGVFGVFDGVGGGPRGGEAAKLAKQTLEEMSQKYRVDNFHDLVKIAKWMHENVRNQSVGTTTAVLTKIQENEEGEKELHFASLGDSRLYILRGEELSQVTTDENVTEEDLDSAGIFDEEVRDDYLKHGIKNGVGNQEKFRIDERNFGKISLQSGDRIVLCTDGVTGDVEEEKMSSEVMKRVLDSNQGDDQMAAKMLVFSAKKRDDRTAIVISV